MCKHYSSHTATGVCIITNLTLNQIQQARVYFCETTSSSYEDQNHFVSRFMTVKKCNNNKSSNDKENTTSRNINIDYFIYNPEASDKVECCKSAFMMIYGIKKDRLSNIGNHALAGKALAENRGGYRRSELFIALEKQVIDHISTFYCAESHYARSGNIDRHYLPSELNVYKMHKLFLKLHPLPNDQITKACKYKYYNKIFLSKFNLGFGCPRKDICSDCLKMRSKMLASSNENEKKESTGCYMLHKLKAKVFFKCLEFPLNKNTIRVVFDLNQNKALPKTPIGKVYYSRQLWFHSFGIILHYPGHQILQHNHIYC